MEREKMIEEMIRDFSGDMEYVTSEMIQDSIKRGGYVDFVKMYDIGYRKIPDGAVVLTKEELNDKDVMKEMYELANACHDEKCAELNLLSYQYHKLEQQLIQARKETVKEICDFAESEIKRLGKETVTDSFGERPLLVEEMQDESEEPEAEEKTPAAIDQIRQIMNQEKLEAYAEARDILVEAFRDNILKDYVRRIFYEKFGV